jgi:integrase
MGTVFKPFVTRPLPEGAKLVTRTVTFKGKPERRRFAVWVDASGRKRQAPVTAGNPPRLRVRAGTYTAQFKGGDGVVLRKPTGCKTLDAARAALADLVARAEKVRVGVVTQAEAAVVEHADTPVAEHVDAYVEALARKRGKGARRSVAPRHVTNVAHTLRLAVDVCGFRRLRDLHRDAVERWVQRLLDMPTEAVFDDAGAVVTPARPSARTINARLATLTAWGNWLEHAKRLASNPFDKLRKHVGLVEADDVRRRRRALTADELRRLLTVARLRPVAEFGRPTVRIVDDARPAKSRATWKRGELTFDVLAAAAERGRARLRPDVVARLEHDGRERALLYAVLVTTGLRKGELAALTVGDVLLDEQQPVVVLPGADAKNGQRATLPLRPDVADELRAWVAEKAEAAGRQRVGVAGVTTPLADAPLFYVPTGLVRILDRDLRAAGIPKRDDRGHTVDVHALRHTFCTHLTASPVVAPRTAQAAARHSSLELTMRFYTDTRLLDVAGALAALPALPASEAARATGTDAPGSVALGVALTSGRTRHNGAVSDESAGDTEPKRTAKKRRDSPVITAKTEILPTGIEPVTFSSGGCGNVVASAATAGLTARPAGRCTDGCTENGDRLDVLARAVALVASLPLPDADRADVLDRVVASLTPAQRPDAPLPQVFAIPPRLDTTPPEVGVSRRVPAFQKTHGPSPRKNGQPARGVSIANPT